AQRPGCGVYRPDTRAGGGIEHHESAVGIQLAASTAAGESPANGDARLVVSRRREQIACRCGDEYEHRPDYPADGGGGLQDAGPEEHGRPMLIRRVIPSLPQLGCEVS